MLKSRLTKEEFEKLPDALKEHYSAESSGDGFSLQAEGNEDVSGLKTALTKERENVSALRKAAEAFKDIDPVKHAELLKAADDAANKSAVDKGDWDKLKTQLVDKHQSDIGVKDKEIGDLNQTVQNYLIDSEALKAISEQKGNSLLLLPHIKNKVQVVKNDAGQHVVRVVDNTGNPRLADASGNFMTIKDLVTEFKGDKTYGSAFEGTGQSGSGASGSNGAGETNAAGQAVVAKGDQVALNNSIEAIATGKAVVAQ